MKCIKCKIKNDKNAKFCKNCGETILQNNPSIKNMFLEISNGLNKTLKRLHSFLTCEKILLFLIFLICLSLLKIAFWGIEINGSLETDTSINDPIETNSEVSGTLETY